MQPARILCVDDEEIGLRIRKLTLESRGYAVTIADSAESALSLTDQDFDLYVLDYTMPGMNGGELAERIRSRHPNAKIVFLTAYLSVIPEHMRWADAFMTKSGDPLEFLGNIHALLTSPCPS